MSKMFDLEHYVAKELIKSWFPNLHKDESWMNTEDAQMWQDIAYADARVAVEAIADWNKLMYDDGK